MNENEIIELYNVYKSANIVSKKSNINKKIVYKILAKNKILSFTNIEEELIKKIEELYLKNYSIAKIGKELCLSKEKVTQILLYSGIEMRTRTSKYKIDDIFFETINTESKAYFLGLMYADGYVSKDKDCITEITLKDKILLEVFKKELKTNFKILDKYVNGKKYYRLTIHSKKINLDLKSLGCVQNKSLILKFPSEVQVPKHLVHHFMRGYFDGDGCVSYENLYTCRFRVIGTEDFLCKYKEILKEQTKVKTISIKNSKGRAFELDTGGRKNCLKIYNFLYHESEICLDRKKAKFINMIDDKKKMMITRPSFQKWNEKESCELLETP